MTIMNYIKLKKIPITLKLKYTKLNEKETCSDCLTLTSGLIKTKNI